MKWAPAGSGQFDIMSVDRVGKMNNNRTRKIATFIENMSQVPMEHVFNPWGTNCEFDADPNASRKRKQRLSSHSIYSDIETMRFIDIYLENVVHGNSLVHL